MKILLSGKILVVALVAIVLTACGGSSNNRNASSSSVASVAASSVATSEAASSEVASSEVASSEVASSEAASSEAASSEVASSVATSEAASSVMESSSSEASSSAPSAALVIYEEDMLPGWKAWDCCRGTTPVALVTSEVEHGKAVRFSITGDGQTVVGFSSRTAHGAVDGVAFDATDIKTTGTISFDLKLITAATAGTVDWKFKVESTNAATAAEVDLTDNSQEGHASPVLNTWQTYTFNISTLETAGLNEAAMDLFMVFPAWGTGTGAVYEVDNVKIWATGADTPE